MAYDYQAQIERLTKNPEHVYSEWIEALGLFQFIGDPNIHYNAGCLTHIKSTNSVAFINGGINEELTTKIKEDERIPSSGSYIKPEHFAVFLEYRNIIDNLENKQK